MMLPPSPASDPTLAAARAHAQAGAWGEVRALLAERRPAAGSQLEVALLYAEALVRTGHSRDARAVLEEALPVIERAGDRAALRRGTNMLGVAHFELGDIEEAESAWARALELARYDEDYLLIARATNNLGTVENVRGRREAALSLYQLAIPAYQRLGNPLGLAESFHNMAITYRDSDQLDEADEYERRAIEFAGEARSPRLTALARLGRAELSLRRGDPKLAEASARYVARAFAELHDPIREADAMRLAGLAGLELGQLEEATAALDTAVHLAREHGHALNEAESLAARGKLRARVGDRAGARADGELAIVIFARLAATAERDAVAEWLASLD